MAPFELSGTLEFGDLARLAYFHTLRKISLFFLIVLFVVLLSLGVQVLMMGSNFEFGSGGFTVVAVIVAWIVLLAVTPYRSAKKTFATQAAIHGLLTSV